MLFSEKDKNLLITLINAHAESQNLLRGFKEPTRSEKEKHRYFENLKFKIINL